ncbi:CoA-binding protein [Demequina sp. NBRC 110057]|uniref:CoA-binding protein n=1 Tax=Demequina sp. NBRC 110057 TaxID=1570346 RepID=UPI000A0420C8|nr:CoA-binding protein [Demequina sp. NBRC 110057]
MSTFGIEPVSFEGADACPAPAPGHLPDDEALVTALAEARTVAVVGASPSDHRTSYAIAVWLMEHTPYEVYLVNPVAVGEEIRGHAFYSSLEDLPVRPDIVDVFRRSEHVGPVAAEAVAAQASVLWMQLGVVNDEAGRVAHEAGLTVVQNRCLKVEYDRLRADIEETMAG